MDPLDPFKWIHWIYLVEHPLQWMSRFATVSTGPAGSTGYSRSTECEYNTDIVDPVNSETTGYNNGASGITSMDPLLYAVDPSKGIYWLH